MGSKLTLDQEVDRMVAEFERVMEPLMSIASAPLPEGPAPVYPARTELDATAFNMPPLIRRGGWPI